MKHGKIIPHKQPPDLAQNLANMADKCEAEGARDLAAQMRKLSGDLASERSLEGRPNWSLFKPFKDNKLWRRLLSIAVGVAFVVWGLMSISKRHITAGRYNPHTYYAANEPFRFWIMVVVVLFLGVACVYRGVRGKR